MWTFSHPEHLLYVGTWRGMREAQRLSQMAKETWNAVCLHGGHLALQAPLEDRRQGGAKKLWASRRTEGGGSAGWIRGGHGWPQCASHGGSGEALHSESPLAGGWNRLGKGGWRDLWKDPKLQLLGVASGPLNLSCWPAGLGQLGSGNDCGQG